MGSARSCRNRCLSKKRPPPSEANAIGTQRIDSAPLAHQELTFCRWR